VEEALVIIDMQPYFVDGLLHKRVEPLITNIQREIRRAVSLREWVLLVEYEDCGETDPRITESLRHYSRVAVATKQDDDGSIEILAGLAPRPNELRITGINSHACVLKTVRGLSGRGTSDIQVIADCTDSTAGHKRHRRALWEMSRMKYVEVI
jgi:nicotinamidase-related amidase